MKKIIIFCDGGLGNRLGVLIGGIITAKKLNLDYEICWPANSWCGCDFVDLFDTNKNIINKNINELFLEDSDDVFLIHENQTKSKLKKIYSHSLQTLELLKNCENNIIYYHNQIPKYYDKNEIINTLSSLKIKKNITDEVKKFSKEHDIENRIGVHIRKTDFLPKVDDKIIFDGIRNSNNLFFICSDDSETEKNFSNLLNVVIHNKKNYAEKLNPSTSWNDKTVDYEGREFYFNIKRNSESVIEAFIDMLILSRTKIHNNTMSTFLTFANHYSNLNLWI
jgi:hypothetical protein